MNIVQRILGVVIVGIIGMGGWVPMSEASEMFIRPQPIAWVIEAAEYTGDIKEQIARMEGRFTIRVMQDGWTEIPLAIAGATITAIDVNKSGDAHLAPRGQSYVLVVSRKGTYKVQVKFSTALAQDSQFEGVRLSIPQATFSTLTLFVPRKDVELRQQDQLYVEHASDGSRGGVKLTARLGASEQIDLRWRTKPATPVNIEPVLYGEVNTLVTLEEQLARLMSIIDYRMAQGETRTLSVQLPTEVNLLNVRGAGIDDWHVTETEGHKTLLVTLNFSFKDSTYRLILEGEQTLADHSSEYQVPALRLAGVKQERGYIALSRSGNIELVPSVAEGINRVDVRELPEALSASMGSPAILAFKYHQHPYQVTLALTRHQDHAVLAAIAERGELITVLSQQGELITRATYLIKANKKQYLGVVLPKDATLWSCIVSGKSVKPVEGKNSELLVPLDAMTDSAEAVAVELVYFEERPELTGVGRFALQGPVLDVPTTIANWSVYAPNTVKFLKVSGNLDRGYAQAEFLDEPFNQMMLAEASGRSGIVSQVMGGDRRQDEDKDRLYYKRKQSGLGEDRGAGDQVAAVKRAELGRDGKEVINSYGEIVDASMTVPQSAPTPSISEAENFRETMSSFETRLQDTGILPLNIRLPKAGSVYHFNRLMTTQEALILDATFVHVKLPWVPFAN